MPQLSTPAPSTGVLEATKKELNRLRKGRRAMAKSDPMLAWLITPLYETATLLPQIIGDVDEILLAEKKKKKAEKARLKEIKKNIKPDEKPVSSPEK